MAEAINTGGIRPVTLPNQFPPMPAVARILSRFDRDQLHGFIAVAIDLADAMDGDADLEGECSEDEVSRCTDTGQPVRGDGPGCDIADAGENAWIEWTTMRGSQKRGPNIAQMHEDAEDDNPAEDDDPSGQCDEDGINTGSLSFAMHGQHHEGPGCPIADPAEYGDGRGAF